MNMVPCHLSHVLLEEHTDRQVIFLTEVDGTRRLAVAIGQFEIGAIHRGLQAEKFARPLTHDLMLALISATGYTLSEVRIVDQREGTYYAELILEDKDGEELIVDCRPSDAIALLVRSPGAMLFVGDGLLEDAE